MLESTGPIPTLHTERLRLRPYTMADAPHVQRMAGSPAIASTTLALPHPYLDGMAEAWIGTHAPGWEARERLVLAIATPAGELRGAIHLALALPHRRAELGYWIGESYWGQGFATEAARAVLAFGFEQLNLNRVQAMHLTRNPASGRVLAKIGMKPEGVSRQLYVKDGRAEDVSRLAILRDEWARS